MPTITFTIPPDKFDKFKKGLLHFYPVPTDENGDPLVAENTWLLRAAKQVFIDLEYRYRNQQARIAAADAETHDDGLLEAS